VTQLQLTYTSVDLLDGAQGGWQVMQTSPGMAPAQIDAALRSVVTRLDIPIPSRYPSQAELGELPRRLHVRIDEDGTGYAVHTAVAGSDASGRPGNVFNHAVVVPEATSRLSEDQPRLLQLWRSHAWLAPYGPDAVRRAVPPSAGVPVGDVVSRDSVAQCLADPARSALVGQVLDGVTQALEDDGAVVVLSDMTPADLDSCVTLLGAVAFLCSPPLLMKVSFSTYERVHGFTDGRPAVLSIAPRDDAGELRTRRGVRVVDPATSVAAPGSSDWAALAHELSGRPPSAVSDRLLALDELADFNREASAKQPHFALALALAEVADDPSQSPAVAAVLARVPQHLVEDADSRELMSQVVGAGSLVEQVRAGAYTDPELAGLLRQAPQESRSELARAVAARLQELEVGSPATVDLAAALVAVERAHPGTLAEHERLLAAVLAGLPERWWMAAPETADRTAGVLTGGLALIADASRISAECEARLRPHLFAALLHVLAGAGSVRANEAALRAQLGEAPQLAVELTNGLRPAADMVRDNEPVARALLAALVFGADEGSFARQLVEALDKPLEVEDQQVLKSERAEVAVTSLILDVRPEPWSAEVLARQHLDAAAVREELKTPQGHVALMAFERGA
jgi:hypothetical protein